MTRDELIDYLMAVAESTDEVVFMNPNNHGLYVIQSLKKSEDNSGKVILTSEEIK